MKGNEARYFLPQNNYEESNKKTNKFLYVLHIPKKNIQNSEAGFSDRRPQKVRSC